MRLSLLLAVAALFLSFPTCPDCVQTASPGVPAPEAARAETQPTGQDAKKPAAKVKSVDDEVKALALKPMKLGTAMDKFKKVDKQLKGWAGSGATDFDEVRKAGVLVAGCCKAVEWKKEKKREKDAKAFDEIVTELDTSAHKLADAAGAKDSGAVKSAAGEVSQHCSDCHGKFK